MYNPYNLEADIFDNLLSSFKLFLAAEKIADGSARSYLSDVRHFLVWLVGFLKENHIEVGGEKWDVGRDMRVRNEENEKTHPHFSSPDTHLTSHPYALLTHVNQKVLEAYKEHLTADNTPLKSINRSFSSLRRFGDFLKDQGYPNHFDTLRNISPNQPFPEEDYHLGEFKTHLWKNNSSKLTIKNYLNDVKQFISWMDSHGLRADSRGSVQPAPVNQIRENPFKNPRKS